MKTSCVYAIVNIKTSRRYVGSTGDFRTRMNGHRSMLRRGIHENSYLQRAWNKYGEAAFVFEVIESCPLELLHIVEQRELDAAMPNVYNIGLVAACPTRGLKKRPEQTRLGSVLSPETLRRKRETCRLRRANRSHCKNGHKWIAENLREMFSASGRYLRTECKVCRSLKCAEKWKEHKATREPLSPRVVTPEFRATLKAAWKARGGGHWKGQKFSEAHKAKLREAWVRRKARKVEVA